MKKKKMIDTILTKVNSFIPPDEDFFRMQGRYVTMLAVAEI